MLSPEAETVWRQRMADTARIEAGAFLPAAERVTRMQDPERTHGTVNFLAQDAAGHIASAVSTSGWAFKYPGRVGDSPLIGAGNYCDDRYGACACTGLGEWAIRAGTARAVVQHLAYGLTLEEACRAAIADLLSIPLPSDVEPIMNLVAIDADGHHAGFSTDSDRTYLWQQADRKEPIQAARRYLSERT
jgi:beta-aspartyl-peptidase (threonine type)